MFAFETARALSLRVWLHQAVHCCCIERAIVIARSILEVARSQVLKFHSCAYSKPVFVKTMSTDNCSFHSGFFQDCRKVGTEEIGDVL